MYPQYFTPFYCQMIVHYVDILYFIYPFIHWWLFGLFNFGEIMNCATMNFCVQFFLWEHMFSFLLGIHPGEELLGQELLGGNDGIVLSSYKQMWFSVGFTSLSTLVNCFFSYSHSVGCKVGSLYSFDLYFPCDSWCWTSFHKLFGYLLFFF